MHFKKILVTTDLSSEAERAFPAVAALARKLGAEVVLLHAIENVGIAPVGEGGIAPSFLPGTKEEMARARTVLAEHHARSFEGVKVTPEVVVVPSVPHAICDHARDRGCDLIAISTHGRSGFRRLIMGSVAEAVLRHARVPVLVFPRQE
jgi:nucleotide-binding universal stress UspA family protein